MTVEQVVVVGAGLIGASAGLALRRAGVRVFLADVDETQLRLAADLGAGEPLGERAGGAGRIADVALLCVPPDAIAHELVHLQRMSLAGTYSDVCSIKTQPQVQAQELGADMTTYVGGHPLAGRERAGAAMARADLFLGVPWVLTPSTDSTSEALFATRQTALLCGAEPRVMTAADHDRAMAVVSHLPQLLASVLARQVLATGPEEAGLAGRGFRDMTRIADSDPRMWAQIAAGNAGPLSDALRRVSAELAALAVTLESNRDAASVIEALIASGNDGRARLPGKHGTVRRRYVAVPVVVADEPGALARLLLDAGEAGVNVEDLSLEHSPGAPVGLCELLVEPADAPRLALVLAERGWVVHHDAARR